MKMCDLVAQVCHLLVAWQAENCLNLAADACGDIYSFIERPKILISEGSNVEEVIDEIRFWLHLHHYESEYPQNYPGLKFSDCCHMPF